MATILVIEDDSAMRQAVTDILKREGHLVAEAIHGGQALESLKTVRVDVVITDIIMPEKEGVETIREIRQAYPHVKIVAMSGGGRYDDSEYYLSMARFFGTHETLSKPFTRADLLDALARVLGDDQSALPSDES